MYAAPTPERLQRPPIVRTVRIIAWIAVSILVYNTLVIGVSLAGLLKSPAWLVEVTITLFSIEIVAMPLLVVVAIRRIMR
jgi:hypothetical protein